MKKIIIVVLLLVIMGLTGCTPSVENYVEEVHTQPGKNLYKVLKHELSEVVNQEFVSLYMEKYSLVELLEKFSELGGSTGTQAFSSALSYSGKEETIYFDWSEVQKLKGAPGYYADEEDLSDKESISGGFNRGKYNEVFYETKYQYREVYNRGDWQVIYAYGDNYYKGRYEWVNGKFYDEPAKWVPYSDVYVYYKGKSVIDYDGSLSTIRKQSFSIIRENGEEYYIEIDRDGYWSRCYISKLKDKKE